MDDLIEALNIVRPYMNDYGLKFPTHCEHDVMTLNVDPEYITKEDLARLEELSFTVSEEYDGLCSYDFGSF